MKLLLALQHLCNVWTSLIQTICIDFPYQEPSVDVLRSGENKTWWCFNQSSMISGNKFNWGLHWCSFSSTLPTSFPTRSPFNTIIWQKTLHFLRRPTESLVFYFFKNVFRICVTLACLFVWRVGTDSPFVYSGNTKSRRWNVGHCQLFGDLPLQSYHLTATMIMMMMMMVLIRNTKDDHGRDILVIQECLRGFANINPFTDPCLSLN